MPSKPEPPPEPLAIDIEIDISPEAQSAYLDAIRYLVQRIRDKRATVEPVTSAAH